MGLQTERVKTMIQWAFDYTVYIMFMTGEINMQDALAFGMSPIWIADWLHNGRGL